MNINPNDFNIDKVFKHIDKKVEKYEKKMKKKESNKKDEKNSKEEFFNDVMFSDVDPSFTFGDTGVIDDFFNDCIDPAKIMDADNQKNVIKVIPGTTIPAPMGFTISI